MEINDSFESKISSKTRAANIPNNYELNMQ